MSVERFRSPLQYVTQLHYARKGEVTGEMARVAEQEKISPELVREEVAREVRDVVDRQMAVAQEIAGLLLANLSASLTCIFDNCCAVLGYTSFVANKNRASVLDNIPVNGETILRSLLGGLS